MPNPRRRAPRTMTLAALALIACDPNDDDMTQSASLPEGCDRLVEVSADAEAEIIEALVAAEDGQTICLGAGRFTLRRQLTSVADDLTIRGAGMSETILDFSDQVSGANGLLIEGDGNVVEELAVRGTAGDGIRANDVEGIIFQRLDVGWDSDDPKDNGAYALYPVQSTNVVVRDCVAHGARDAGIYLGQSTSSLLENNEAYGNVIGIEVENSTDTLVQNNHTHDNTNGLLIITLPGLDIGDGKRANARDNVIENNNVPNFGDDGTVIGVLPRGIGVLLVAADDNEVWDNQIRGNGTAGFVMMSYHELYGLSEPMDDQFDLYPQGNFVHDNTFEGNGEDPDPLMAALVGGADPMPSIIVDGCTDLSREDSSGELANCIDDGNASFIDVDVCGERGGATDDASPYDCRHDPLSTQSPIED